MRGVGAVVALAIALAGCGRAEAGGEGGGAGGGAPPPMPVDVAVAVPDTVIELISATGEIEAEQAIEVRPEVDGRIVEILVREGTEVRAGAPLFKVDDAELRAQVARLEAQRDLAQQALARTRALLEQDAASEAELEQAEAQARSTQAELDLQSVRLERTVVRASFAGVAGERLVSLGDFVTSSDPLVTLQTVNPMRASFEVPERYAVALEEGQSVTFRVAALPEREFTGVVDFVDPRVRLPARTILVKARVPNPDRRLQSGMFIEASLTTEVRPNAVVVPEEAVLQLDQGTFVWVIGSGGQALRRPVVLGIRRPGEAEIRSGVEAGETVITAGMERLFEGANVVPREPVDTGARQGPPSSPGDSAPGDTAAPPEPEGGAAGDTSAAPPGDASATPAGDDSPGGATGMF